MLMLTKKESKNWTLIYFKILNINFLTLIQTYIYEFQTQASNIIILPDYNNQWSYKVV